MKAHIHFFIYAVVFGSFVFFSKVYAQTAPLEYYIQAYQFESEMYDGDGSVGADHEQILIGVIQLHDVPWVQLHFSKVNLGYDSYIIIRSLQDNKWQKLDAVTMNEWYNYSAYFNGDGVEIVLYLSQTDHQVFIKIDEIVAGEWVQLEGQESQCGPTDDRIASNQPATSRLLSVGCTAWIIPNGKFVSAGHCLSGSSSTVVQFNVPLSLPGGTLQHPGPEDQYSVNVASKIFTNGGIGNDWGVFEVFPNSITGLMPKQAQNAFWPLVQNLGPTSIRITGYGVDQGTANQTQQTHVGPNAGSSGTTMRYVTDTEGGNSGSPVIDEATGNAVGVHTHGGCTSSGGNNNGTSTFHTAFWSAVDQGAGGCQVEFPSNPAPSHGQTGVPLNLTQLTWSNGAGSNSNELYFGTNPSSLNLVQSGTLATSWTITGVSFDYGTTYYWRVNEIGDSCNTNGPVWQFTTVTDPNIVTLFCDDFTGGLGNWTITNDGGAPSCVWTIHQASEYTLPSTAEGNVMSADADACNGTTGNSQTTATHHGIDASIYQSVMLEFDNDWQAIDAKDFAYVDVSTNGGTTWQNVLTFDIVDVRNTHEVRDISSLVAGSTFSIRFKSVQPGWDWWWAVDNICIYGTDIVPVELASFTASASEGLVELSWITATETNNQGFEIQRSTGSEFETIAFIEGHGTTTETKAYSYFDRSVNVGYYNYRLKQVDFDGTFEYSNIIEVDVPAPAVFALEQNYPNPFNPSTTIRFSIPEETDVRLNVYNTLGQEVAEIINSRLKEGYHEVNFDAVSLTSGIYFYRIEADKFVDVKKMIIIK